MFQTLIISGNLGKDPEKRSTPSGQSVCSFNVATNRKFKNQAGAEVKETTWFRVTTWGATADACAQYLHKGGKVLVEGRLTPDPVSGGPKVYTKQDGTAGSSYEVTASTVRFLSSANESNGNGGSQETPAAETEEEIPF